MSKIKSLELNLAARLKDLFCYVYNLHHQYTMDTALLNVFMDTYAEKKGYYVV